MTNDRVIVGIRDARTCDSGNVMRPWVSSATAVRMPGSSGPNDRVLDEINISDSVGGQTFFVKLSVDSARRLVASLLNAIQQCEALADFGGNQGRLDSTEALALMQQTPETETKE